MLAKIPVIDFGSAHESRARAEIIATIGAAFRDIGFIFLRVPETRKRLDTIYPQFEKVFGLPHAVKTKYARPDLFYQRGWTPPFSEVGVACRRLGDDGKGLADAKENWFAGPELVAEHELVKRFPQLYPANIWPDEVLEFKDALLELYDLLYAYGRLVLRALETYLGKPHGYFNDIVRDSPTVIRAIHYPPVTPEQVGKIVWACKHTDINLITVLPASTRPGLWILRRDGTWMPGSAPQDCVIVQVADMLDYLTGGHFISAVHEVRAPNHPTEKGRYSAALFIHARSDVLLAPEVSEQEKPLYPPITAGELLLQRLRAIGLGV